MMKISIVTPCLNAGKYIQETIESVLNQTAVLNGIVKLEYIVIDGGSNDNTLQILEKYKNKIRIISEKDEGMYDALAKGLSLVDGDFIGYLNAGDYYHKCAFDVLAEIWGKFEAKWITGISIGYNSKSIVTNFQLPFIYRRRFFQLGFYDRKRLPHLQQESTFWHFSLNRLIDFEKLRKFKLAGDYYLWREFSRKYDLYIVQAYLGGFKKHDKQLSGNIMAYKKELKSLSEKKPLLSDYLLLTFDKFVWMCPNRVKKLFNPRIIRYNYELNEWVL